MNNYSRKTSFVDTLKFKFHVIFLFHEIFFFSQPSKNLKPFLAHELYKTIQLARFSIPQFAKWTW